MLAADEILGVSLNHLVKTPCGASINKRTEKQWNKLVNAAANDGIDIAIASSFRSFNRQQVIWNRKCTGMTPIKSINGQNVDLKTVDTEQLVHAILRFSALPGTSRHHWGTDIDVFSPSLLNNAKLQLEPWEYAASGPMANLTKWLKENMAEFEFFMPYDLDRNGVAVEPWHISHGKIAFEYQQQLNIKDLRQQIVSSELECKEYILDNLTSIVDQYVLNVGQFNV